MASNDSGSMKQNNADSSADFQTQANAGSQVNQAAQDIHQVNQTSQGSENQTIGQVYGGVVVYVSGGQAVINPSQGQGAQSQASQPGDSEAVKELGPNPYKGLLAFHEKDQDLYFGRSREIEALREQCLALLEQSNGVRLLPIYGPSGSGKSSLARAGLIPELGQRPLPGRDRARVALMVPGTQPLQALATVLARIATNDVTPVQKIREFTDELAVANRLGEYDGLQRIASALPEIATFPLIVLVDQFEEVYSLCEDGEARDALVSNLLYAAKERSRYVSVLMTMRSDFVGETHRHPTLGRLFSAQGFLVPPMDGEALREVIALPAERAGHGLDDATIQLLIEQTEGREGALPLLQFALARIWEGLAEGSTPAKTLEKIGGVGGALAGEAQRVYDGLSEAEQEIARRLFLGLVQLGEGTRDTRRRASVSGLMARADQPEEFRQVMERFTAPGVRLMTVSATGSEETAEVTHEALFEHWDELNVWLDDSREDLRFQRRLDEAVEYWDEQKRPAGLLWRNPDLGLLRSYHHRLGEQMTMLQLAFFEASVEQETQQRRQETRQKQVLAVGASLLAILAGGMTLYGLRANRAEQQALSLQWAAQSQQGKSPRIGPLLALEAFKQSQRSQGEVGEINNALRDNLAKLPPVTLNHESEVRSVSFSSDGKRVATASVDGTAGVWDVKSGERLATLNHESGVLSVSFSPDGKRVATASRDGTAGVWDVKSGKRLATLNHESEVLSVSFSPDGKRVATASRDETAGVWEVESGERIATLNHESWVFLVNFSPDGKHVVTASDDGTAGVWELESGEGLATLNHEDKVVSVSFSSDGKHVVTASFDGTAGVWEVESGKRVATLNHESEVLSVSFSQDGKRVATASSDGTAGVWDVESGERLATLNHEDKVMSVSFSPDGKRIATASSDGSAGVWEVESGERVATLNHENWVFSVSFNSNGKRIATASLDGSAGVWEVESGERVATLNHEPGVLSVSFSPDGKRATTASSDGTVGVWDVESGERVATLNHEAVVWSVSFNSDGKRVATASSDGTAGVWDVESGERLATLNHESEVTSVSFNSDGKRVATASDDGTAGVWDVESGERLATLNHESGVSSVSFSPDGKRVATASRDGTAGVHWLWSGDLAKESCKRLHRNLTALEWKKYHQTNLSRYRLTCDDLPVHPSLLTEAQKLAEAGEVRKATALYSRLLKASSKVEPPLDLDPWTKDEDEQDPKAMAKAFASGMGLVREAEKLAQDGNIDRAIKHYQRALKLNPEVDFNPATDEVEQDPEAVAKSIAEAAAEQ